jgi:hypothetical protein
MKAYDGLEMWQHSFLTSTLGGVNGQRQPWAVLSPGKVTPGPTE